MRQVADIVLLEPNLPGVVSGGFRYNREVAGILEKRGVGRRITLEAGTADPAAAIAALPDDRATVWLIDSLFLSEDPEAFCGVLRAGNRAQVAMLFHYLPSADPFAGDARDELRERERHWLRLLDRAVVAGRPLVPSLGRLGEEGQRAARRCLVAEPGLDHVARFLQGASTRSLRRAGERIRLVTVGNLQPAKGQCELLETLRQSAKPDAFELTVIGSARADPAYGRRFRRALRNAETRLPAKYLGPVPNEEVLAAVHQADVLVSASVVESFGLAVAEACAMGVPAIVFEAGEVRRWVEDGRNGRVLAAGDFRALRGALERLAADPGDLDRWRRHARAGIGRFEPYRWTRTAETIVSLAREKGSGTFVSPGQRDS
jgi:glycosyltransferase involved in cell wall biosynthesis